MKPDSTNVDGAFLPCRWYRSGPNSDNDSDSDSDSDSECDSEEASAKGEEEVREQSEESASAAASPSPSPSTSPSTKTESKHPAAPGATTLYQATSSTGPYGSIPTGLLDRSSELLFPYGE